MIVFLILVRFITWLWRRAQQLLNGKKEATRKPKPPKEEKTNHNNEARDSGLVSVLNRPVTFQVSEV